MSKTIEEIEADQRAERREIKSDAELLAGLLKHPGWARYIALIESVAENYSQKALAPLENILEVTKAEFAKGALTGLALAASLPSRKMQQANELNPDDEDS